jgi:hypothetical protein
MACLQVALISRELTLNYHVTMSIVTKHVGCYSAVNRANFYEATSARTIGNVAEMRNEYHYSI